MNRRSLQTEKEAHLHTLRFLKGSELLCLEAIYKVTVVLAASRMACVNSKKNKLQRAALSY